MADTVQVRILVVVDSDGNWGASGHPNSSFGDLIHCADGLNGGLETQAWITAEVPLPSPPMSLAGAVESAETIDPKTQ